MKRLLNTFLILAIAVPCYAQANLGKVRIRDFSGGMDSNSIADILAPNQAASMVNVSLNRKGRLVKRKGQSLFNVDGSNTAFTGIGRFDPDATTSYLVAASDVDVIRATAGASVWTLANPASGLTAGKNTEFVQANDLLFVLNGFDRTAWYDGSAWTLGGTYPASPPTAATGAWLRNYLFLGGATTENDWVYFSNNLEPTVFDASDIIKINTGDGQKIQKMSAYRLNELIIYKERSIFVLDITGSTPITDWTVQPISTVVGTIAPRSVVSLGNDQWFLSSEPIAIRSLVRSSFDKILINFVSTPVQDIFDGTNDFGFNINTAQISKAAAVLFDNKYIIAIPTGTSLVNNTVLVHDFINSAWYIIKGWYPAGWIEFDNKLYMIDANDGRVVQVFSGTTGDFPEGPGFVDAASVPSVGVEWVYVSRSIDFDNPETFKQADALSLEFDPTGNYEAEVLVNMDNNGWVDMGDINLAGNSLTLPVDLPTTLSNSGVSRETFHLQSQGEFKKMQVMTRNRASEETVTLERLTIFSNPSNWRRE